MIKHSHTLSSIIL